LSVGVCAAGVAVSAAVVAGLTRDNATFEGCKARSTVADFLTLWVNGAPDRVGRNARSGVPVAGEATLGGVTSSTDTERVSSGGQPVPLLEPLLSDDDDRKLRIFVVVWLLSVGFFWSWWLQPEHWVSPWGLFFNSTLLAWANGLVAYLFFFAVRATRPNPVVTAPPDLRVAMIVTKAPSEPWSVLTTTLLAMLDQNTDRRHDVWIADEQPTDESLEWCRRHGVSVSSRFGVEEYHRPDWPRRTRSKEGNLAYFYDMYGYERYDVVVQLDADHVPTPAYLEEMLRPFAHPKVGYVPAPSICDANRSVGWTVTARLYKEASLHGVVQAGCNGGYAPVCIGSHYAVRTSALKAIGGIGPELAEDYSTSLLMQSGGWDGVFAIDAEAHGDGPESFGEMMTQELQWSRSLAIVGARYARGRWRSIPLRARARLAFSLAFYPLFATQMLVGSFFPLLALLLARPWVSVPLSDFWVHILPAVVTAQLATRFLKRRNVLRPTDARLVGWQVIVFTIMRWPMVLWGVVQGTFAGLTKRTVPFKVTPKGTSTARVLPLRFIVPILLVSLTSAFGAVFIDGGPAAGYKFLCAVTALTYLGAVLLVVALHQRDNRRRRPSASGRPTADEWFRFGGNAVVASGVCAIVIIGVLLQQAI